MHIRFGIHHAGPRPVRFGTESSGADAAGYVDTPYEPEPDHHDRVRLSREPQADAPCAPQSRLVRLLHRLLG